jgi:anaerobic magnesium-protoporphyrin IX monomethyl ester cyclase
LKILLTHGYFLSEDKKEKMIMKPYVPLGILYISAYLTEHGFPNEVYDSTFSTFPELTNHLTHHKPELVGIYTNLMTKLNVLKLIRFIRSNDNLKNCKIVLGGPEIKYNAENFLNYGADVVIPGEGEETMLEVVNSFNEDHQKDLSLIDGIVFKNNDGINFTKERKLIRNFDLLPLPARDKIDFNKYIECWRSNHGYSMMSVSTMRGCPYTCKWCSRSIYGNSYRRRSAKLVAEELRLLNENYSPGMFWFVDDVFTISHIWIKDFSDELEKRKLKISYECITRSDRLNEEIIKLLKQTGCHRVWIGAESGSQKILDAMDRRVKIEQVREMIALCKSHGIQTGTFIMFGYPGETIDDIEKTLEHLKLSDPDQFTITLAYPINGTPFYYEVEDKFIKKSDWQNTTDRDIDFKRNYKSGFYKNVIRYVNNEMMFSKMKNYNGSGNLIRRNSHRIKSFIARNLMRVNSKVN